MINYLINNVDLTLACLLASIRAIAQVLFIACTVQGLVYQLSNKKINLYKRFEKYMLS